MKIIASLIKKDIKRRIKSPFAIIIMLLIPIIMTAILGSVFSSKDKALPKIKILINDIDKNIASKFLIQSFDAPKMKEMFQITIVNEEQGKKMISKGKASALLIIPKNFTENILNTKKTNLILIKNPSEQFLPQIVEEFMNTFSIIISGFVQIFSDELSIVKNLFNTSIEKISIKNISPFFEKTKIKIIKLKNYISPPLINLKQEIEQKGKKVSATDIFSAMLPAISIMFVLFIIEIFLRDILTEKDNGTLLRIMFSPTSSSQYIISKIASGCIMGTLVLLIIILIGMTIFGIIWGNFLYLLLFIIVVSFWISAFFAMLNSFFKNKNQAGAIASPVILIFAAVGGSMIPYNMLPKSIHTVSLISINFWFIKGIENINKGKFPAIHFIVLIISGLMLFALSLKLLKKRITS